MSRRREQDGRVFAMARLPLLGKCSSVDSGLAKVADAATLCGGVRQVCWAVDYRCAPTWFGESELNREFAFRHCLCPGMATAAFSLCSLGLSARRRGTGTAPTVALEGHAMAGCGETKFRQRRSYVLYVCKGGSGRRAYIHNTNRDTHKTKRGSGPCDSGRGERVGVGVGGDEGRVEVTWRGAMSFAARWGNDWPPAQASQRQSQGSRPASAIPAALHQPSSITRGR